MPAQMGFLKLLENLFHFKLDQERYSIQPDKFISHPLFDDTVSCLRELQNSGYRLIVISNWDLTLDKVLTSVGIDRFFEQTFASLAFAHYAALFGAAEPRAGGRTLA